MEEKRRKTGKKGSNSVVRRNTSLFSRDEENTGILNGKAVLLPIGLTRCEHRLKNLLLATR